MVMYDKEYPKKKIEFKPGIKWDYNINIGKKKKKKDGRKSFGGSKVNC